MSESRRPRARLRIGAVAIALAVLIPAAPATALPPDGAGPDTPGTSSSISPSTLRACETISFTVTGYPAGETLYVKIDDGLGYGDTSVQGSGVWHMQAISSSGRVTGSFDLPCDIAPGAHWLRFLASEELHDANGVYQGVLGYTRRGGTDFTVVASTASSSGGGGSSSSPSGTQRAPAAGTTTGSGSEQVGGQGGVLSIDAAAVPTAEPSPTASASAEATPEASIDPTPAAAAEPVEAPVPVVGLVGLGVLVVAGAVAVWLLLRRRAPHTP